MNPDILDWAIVLAAIGAWLAGYAAARAVTRPASPPPGPATPDLGAEPPAVVSLLANRWQLTEDAAEATLLDLAARRHLELRQPGNEAAQTTVHIGQTAPAGLTPYEKRVLDRVGGLAVGGVLPLTALTFRDARQARSWEKRLRAEVVTDARGRGLSQRRFGRRLVALLVTGAAVAAAIVAAAVIHYALRSPDGDGGLAVAASVVTFLVLAGVAARYPGERDTPAGREAAARWLGVRAWLRGHEAFADLPPASVAVWDRYLGYGAALGVTRLASAVLDLGMGNRRLVWSCYGGQWHRVRVRYPKFWGRYGKTARQLITRSVAAILVGFVLVYFNGEPRRLLGELDPALVEDRPFDLAERIGLVVGIGLLAYGGYRLLRALIDLATERTLVGEVLWLDVWRKTVPRKDAPPEPWLHYVAVDNGSADRTTAWALPSGLADRCHDGDTVRLTVRRWSRRVIAMTVLERGRSWLLAEPTVDVNPEKLIAGYRPVEKVPEVSADKLYTVDDIVQLLGIPVRPAMAAPQIGPLSSAWYATVDRNRPVLTVQVAHGAPGRWVWRMNARGTELPGIGDGAYTSGDRAALRAGETTVLLTLMRGARDRRPQLPELLTRAVARLATAARS